jgi:DNA topoisomerase-3
MKQLYLCEKPSQAKDIARVLGANQRNNGYFEGNGFLVTWCFGHLLEMAAPDDYDPALKSWTMESLPIIPTSWVLNVRKDAKKQVKIIFSLFKRVDEIVVSTDSDREGEAIAREVMDAGGWKGHVTRLWLSALNDKSIRKALDNLLPGEETVNLYKASSARSKADWLVGMTLSRLYTLSAQKSGFEGVMSVGRVQTPTLKLVVDRDRLIEGFTPVPYFNVMAEFQKTGIDECFTGKWQVPEELSDKERRCLSQSSAQLVATRCLNQEATVLAATTKRIKEAPPLLFSLSDLQQEASKRFGMGAQEVLDHAQSLYETHKVSSYPRTDCQYLPQSQFDAVTGIIHYLQTMEAFTAIATKADATHRSKVWDDKKITAHHAIIPTGTKSTKPFTDAEVQIFDLICRRYLMQFYPFHEFDQTQIELSVDEDIFHASGKQVIVQGWKEVLQRSTHVNDETASTKLPNIKQNDKLNVLTTKVEDKQTQPPARYTEGTLISAMKNIGKWVENPILKKRLKETAGIGTEATRASIIEVLLKRQFVSKQSKKHLVSSAQARALMDALPDPVKDPATTAVWEQALDDIAQGKGNAEQFVEDQAKMITLLTEQVKQSSPKSFKALESNTERFDCPELECGHTLARRKGKTGFFWGCRNYPECTVTLPDNKGKPGKERSKTESTGQSCPECEQGILLRRTINNGKNKGKQFLGCNRYPECSHTEG